MSSLKLLHSREKRGESVLLKLSVLEEVCLTILFAVDLVW